VIEAARSEGWWRYLAGVRGAVIGMDRFGESAPAAALMERYGFTPSAVLAQARALLQDD
jgi:transketolase